MASIYANATLAIVAAGGNDANYGLRGIRGVACPRNHPQRIAKLSNDAQILNYDFPKLGEAMWSKRGWTFQEILFSQRNLIFCDDSIMWSCSCDEWHERVGPLHRKDFQNLPRRNSDIPLHEPGLFNNTWPDLLGY
jgi:Heterokaryon incompatibility protein (HET)